MDARKNFAYGTVLTPPSPADTGTSLVLNSGEGARFPDPATDGEYNIVIKPANIVPTPSNAEIARVTARSGDTFTITRAQEGSSARTVLAGDEVYLGVTKKTVDDIANIITPEHTAAGAHTTDTINEKTPGAGVTVDGVLLKDGGVTASNNIAVTIADGGNAVGLIITQNDVTNNPNAVTIINAGAGLALDIDKTGTGGVVTINGVTGNANNILAIVDTGTGRSLYVYRNVGSGSANDLVTFEDDHASSTQRVLKIKNDGTGNGLFIDQNGNGDAINIDSETTTMRGLNIAVDALTTGSGIRCTTANSAFSSTSGLINVSATNASATGHVVRVLNAGTGNSLFIDQNGNGTALYIDSESTNQYAINIDTVLTDRSAIRAISTAAYTGTTSGGFIFFQLSNASSTKPVLRIINAGSGDDISVDSGAKLTAAGVWTDASSKEFKEAFKKVSNALGMVKRLPVNYYRYKKTKDRHLGPVAEDFKEIVGVSDGKSLAAKDIAGLALAAVKELATTLEKKGVLT